MTSNPVPQIGEVAPFLDVLHHHAGATTPASSQSQAEKIEQWLRQYGFAYNPFAFTNSERDINLDEHFVEYPDFDKMLGLEDRLFFARTGDGKTAMRLRLQTFYRDAVADHHVFAFSYLIPQEIAEDPPATIDGHIESILTAAVRHAFVFFALRGVDLPILQDEQSAVKLASRLALYFDHYYGLENSWRADLQQALLDHSLQQVVRNLEPVYDDLESPSTIGSINTVWLKRWVDLLNGTPLKRPLTLPKEPIRRWRHFCDLVQATGIQTILILVDSVDIKPAIPATLIAARNPSVVPPNEKRDIVSRMVAIVKPLLAASQEKRLGAGIVWKLFLPLELYFPFSYLSKHFFHDILYWDYKHLQQLLEFRLSAATDGAVTTLLQLVEDDVPDDLETFLIVQSGSSPRYLIYYINKLFGIHVDQTPNGTLPSKLSGSLLAQIHYTPHRSS